MNNEELLMNPLFVKQIKDKPQQDINYKFYKKRIYSITKQLLCKRNSEFPETLKKSFFEYVKNCVEYFEFIDTSDILQSEYSNIDDSLISISDNEDITLEEMNKKLISVKKSSKIEDFMDIGIVKPEPVKFPEQKKIEIKNEMHKKKGIKKKYN
tara:strand:+ start:152 stop:613 length:462 start_codon:yes stop_codon:yes gene_type:complete